MHLPDIYLLPPLHHPKFFLDVADVEFDVVLFVEVVGDFEIEPALVSLSIGIDSQIDIVLVVCDANGVI